MDKQETALRKALNDDAEMGAARAAAVFTRLAQERGLVDVAYAPVDSPWGKLLAAATGRGLVRLAFPEENVEEVLARLSKEISPRILEEPSQLDGVRRELDEYFEGRRKMFDVPLDWQLIRGFRQPVLRITARIPFGETRTYHQVAKSAGNERASRAAGGALGSNPIPIVIPCHRVLRSGGALGGYGGGIERKLWLLHHEGAPVVAQPRLLTAP